MALRRPCSFAGVVWIAVASVCCFWGCATFVSALGSPAARATLVTASSSRHSSSGAEAVTQLALVVAAATGLLAPALSRQVQARVSRCRLTCCRATDRSSPVDVWDLGTLVNGSPLDSLLSCFGQPDEPLPGRLFYGLGGAVGLQDLNLSEELLDYLAEEPVCGSADGGAEQLESLGFLQCVDHESLPGHHYCEGYFHTMATSDPIASAHPRFGHDVEKPAAPVRLRAFAESFRRLNAATLAALHDAAPHGSVLRAALAEGRSFADVAVQVHWGDAVGPQHVEWHVDAPNSALHMAVSVRGNRSLKMKLREPSGLETKVLEEPQQAGDVYIGNPAGFEHGLEYPAASWEERTVAMQFRFLLKEAELRDPSARDGLEDLARAVARQRLRLPSLDEVRRVALELQSK